MWLLHIYCLWVGREDLRKTSSQIKSAPINVKKKKAPKTNFTTQTCWWPSNNFSSYWQTLRHFKVFVSVVFFFFLAWCHVDLLTAKTHWGSWPVPCQLLFTQTLSPGQSGGLLSATHHPTAPAASACVSLAWRPQGGDRRVAEVRWGREWGHRRVAFPLEPLDQRAQIRGNLLRGDTSRCSLRLRPPQTARQRFGRRPNSFFFFRSVFASCSRHMCCAELDSLLIQRALWPPSLMEQKPLPQKINLSHLDDNTFPQVMMLRRYEEADRVNCTFPAQPGSLFAEEKSACLAICLTAYLQQFSLLTPLVISVKYRLGTMPNVCISLHVHCRPFLYEWEKQLFFLLE